MSDTASEVRRGDPAEPPTPRPYEDAVAKSAPVGGSYTVDPADYPVAQIAQEDIDAAMADVAPPEAALGPGPLEPGGIDPAATPVPIADLTVAQLQDRLRALELPVTGTKGELVDRLQAAYDAAGVAEPV